MKKLILAAAIAGVAAQSAQAATVYEGKGLTYEIKGDFQVQLKQDVGNDQNLDVEFDDLEIKNSITYMLNDKLSAVGQLDFGFKDAAEDKQSGDDLEEAYVGFQYDMTRVVVGKMDFASDEFGVEQAVELKSDEDQFDAQGTDGDDVIRVDVELNANTLLVISHEIDAEGEDSANGEYFDLFVGTEVAGLELALAYQDKKSSPTAKSEDTWGVSAAFDAGVAALMADYSSADKNTHEVDQYNLAAVIPVGATKVAIGMVNTDDESQTEDVTEWYANVTYKFPTQKNVRIFAEIADTDETNADLGYLAGMRIKF